MCGSQSLPMFLCGKQHRWMLWLDHWAAQAGIHCACCMCWSKAKLWSRSSAQMPLARGDCGRAPPPSLPLHPQKSWGLMESHLDSSRWAGHLPLPSELQTSPPPPPFPHHTKSCHSWLRVSWSLTLQMTLKWGVVCDKTALPTSRQAYLPSIWMMSYNHIFKWLHSCFNIHEHGQT